MGLDVYFPEDIARGLVSSLSSFLLGQTTASGPPDLSSVSLIIGYTASLGARYGISGDELIAKLKLNLALREEELLDLALTCPDGRLLCPRP